MRSEPRSGIIAALIPLSELPMELRRYVRGGRISVMPAKRAARLLLLDQDGTYWRSGGTVPVSPE